MQPNAVRVQLQMLGQLGGSRRSLQLGVSGSGRNDALTISRLEEWARSGAHWRVIHLSERRAVVEFQQCTGEPIERLESGGPELIAYLQGVESDLDLY